MLIKSELDARVALATGIPVKRVAHITDVFIDELCTAITEHGGFHLSGLGKLVPRIERLTSHIRKEGVQDSMRIRLYFTKSRILKDQIARQFGMKEASMEKNSDEGMTKYAVNEGHNPDKLEKAAAQGCPICAAPVVKHGRVFACPTHGTEPFE
jgi:nucleoid DNA-binding protein